MTFFFVLDVAVGSTANFAPLLQKTLVLVTCTQALHSIQSGDIIDLFRLGGLFSHYRPRDILWRIFALFT